MEKRRTAEVQYLAKVVRGWYECRPQIKESNERYWKQSVFRRNQLQMKAFIHFAIIVKGLRHYRLKLEYLRKLTLYNKKKAVMTALKEHVSS